MESRQGFSHQFGRVRVKKFVQKNRRIQLVCCNNGALVSKRMELVDSMKRRRVTVGYLQEAKWKEDKAKELTHGYKL